MAGSFTDLRAAPSPNQRAPAPVAGLQPPRVPAVLYAAAPSPAPAPAQALDTGVSDWGGAEVLHWLAAKVRLPDYADSFARNEIDGAVLGARRSHSPHTPRRAQ
eukprot:SAG11_NODE_13531_length_651_cov_0.746377_1_plen_104_part_00